jgi:hypothetical protein
MVRVGTLQTEFEYTSGARIIETMESAPCGPMELCISGQMEAADGSKTSGWPCANSLLQATGGSDVHREKIARIQAAIASGSYNVPSVDVADKLIEAMRGDL